MTDQRFIRGVLDQQLGKLADQIGVAAELQLAPDPVEQGGPALFFQRFPHPGGPVAADPSQGLTAPEPVGLAQQRRGRFVVAAGGQGVRLTTEPAELVDVDRFWIDLEQVALGPPEQTQVVADRLPEGGPEPGHVDGKTLSGFGRGLRIPEPVN